MKQAKSRRNFISGVVTATAATLVTTQNSNAQNINILRYSPIDFGAIGDGDSDDTSAFQAALNAMVDGGILELGNYVYKLTSKITVPKNVVIMGYHIYPGNSGIDNSKANEIMDQKSSLRLGSNSTIELLSNASIIGVTILPYGFSIPCESAETHFQANTAIIVSGEDVTVSHCLIIGFHFGIASDGNQRVKIDGVAMDCLNYCIQIKNSGDVSRISNLHCWPYATVQQNIPSKNKRPGRCISLRGFNHWTEILNIFAYGYENGIDCQPGSGPKDVAGSCKIVNCNVDGIISSPTLHGLYFSGKIINLTISNSQVKHSKIGILIKNSNAGSSANIVTSTQLLDISKHGFFLDGYSNTIISNCNIEINGGNWPIAIPAKTSKCNVTGSMFSGASSISNAPNSASNQFTANVKLA